MKIEYNMPWKSRYKKLLPFLKSLNTVFPLVNVQFKIHYSVSCELPNDFILAILSCVVTTITASCC